MTDRPPNMRLYRNSPLSVPDWEGGAVHLETSSSHELRTDRDGMLVYCPCGWAYTFSYVPAGEDISFAYRAHLEGM